MARPALLVSSVPLRRMGGVLVLSVLVSTLVVVLPPPAHGQTDDSTEAQQLQRAESHLESGRPDKAIPILESLYERDPAQTVVFQRLKDAYQENKQYAEAVDLLNDRIDEQPTPALWTEKARLLYQDDQNDRAAEAWQEALDLRPEELSTYRRVYRMLTDRREYEQAIDVLTRARSTLEQSGVFRTDLARLYSLDGQHDKAMQEYVALLSESPDRVNYVKEQLESVVERGEGVPASIEVLESAIDSSSSNDAYRRLLAWLHTETGDYSAAFDVYDALDKNQEQPGRVLLSFAQAAAGAEEYDLAVRAYETALDRASNRSVSAPAQKELGDTYRRWASHEADSSAFVDTSGARGRRYAAARKAYRTFLEEYPDHDAASAVHMELGRLHLEVFRDLEAAAAAFRAVRKAAPDPSATQRAEFNLGRVALLRDSTDRADQIFSTLSEDAAPEALAHRARYERARLHFYQGKFDAAIEHATDVAPNTSSDIANDAIELKVLIQENRGPDSLDSALRLYAEAQFAERSRAYERAATRLDSLLQAHTRHPLADEAQFRRAHVHRARGDTTAAIEAFASVPEQFSDSPYSDQSLFQKAQLQEALGDSDAATETYDRLLTEYPESLLSPDVRTRLRALRRQQG
ncbi:MAG: tetratricopeptide repeat protein [Salinivenus sp.]